MQNDYRIAVLRELRDQQVRFARVPDVIEQSGTCRTSLSVELEMNRECPYDVLFFRLMEKSPDVRDGES
jgi:hypothetical protein